MLCIERDSSVGLLEDAATWNAIASGIPFRQSAWLKSWWQAFGGTLGGDAEPYIITARQSDGEVVALLPLVRRRDRGRWTLTAMGQGDACTDHVSLLIKPSLDPHSLAVSVGQWLASAAHSVADGWQRIEIDGIVDGDAALIGLAEGLRERSATVHAVSRVHTWVHSTNGVTWDGFLGSLSKTNRKKTRKRSQIVEEHPELHWEEPTSVAEVTRSVDRLIEIHQTRWTAVGESGSYASEAMRRFIHAAANAFHHEKRLRLPTLMIGDQAIAAELQVIGDDGYLYCYSTGMDPGFQQYEPGHAMTANTFRFAYQQGLQGVNMMRGDEPYKQRMRGVPHRLVELHAEAPSSSPRLKQAAWLAAFEVTQWVRSQIGRPPVVHVDLHSSI